MSNYHRLPFQIARILVVLSFGLAGALAAPALMQRPVSAAPLNSATTFDVNVISDLGDLNPGDGICDSSPVGGAQCSLRAAIEEANALGGPDTHTINLPESDYPVGATILITGRVRLQGAGINSSITSTTTGETVFDVRLSNVTVDNIGFENCHRAFINRYSLTVSNSWFNNCSPTDADGGGAIYSVPNAILVVSNSHFNNNSAPGKCGGAILSNSYLTVTSSDFSANTAQDGGAICQGSDTGSLSLSTSKLTGNQASQDGGGLYYEGRESLGTRIVWLTDLRENSAQNGGGIFVWSGNMGIEKSSFIANTASQHGGGFYAFAGSTANTISFTNVTFSGNTSDQNGGGIYMLKGSATLSNTTVTRNTADLDNNNDGDGGGLAAAAEATVHFKNSILADNHDASTGKFATVSHDCLGTLTADGNVLVGIGNHATLCTIGGNLDSSRVGSLAIPVDPRLGDLVDSPNDYTQVHPLLHDSPAVDGGYIWGEGCTDYLGNTILVDQRDDIRPIGMACDIGAYESTFTPGLPSLSINNVTVTEGDAGTVAATFTVTLSSQVNWLVLVSYVTQNGTALSGLDYAPESDDLVFQPGETSKEIVVQVYGDTVAEPDETFGVLLFDESHATILNYAGTGTIHDDDGPSFSYKVFLPLITK